MDLVLIRHPRVNTPPGLCYGQTDVPLAPGWEAEVDALRVDIGGGFDSVHCSPLSRSLLPAQRFTNGKVEVDSRLMELSFGEWENQPWDSLPAPEVNTWMARYWTERPPGGETMRRLRTRAVSWLENIRGTDQDRVLAVTHAGVIRVLLGHILGLPNRKLFRMDISHLRPIQIRLGRDPNMDALPFR